MEPFERLDGAMNEQRLRLRMNWRQVSDAAGISYTALRAIRRGTYRPTELTARGLDAALQWAPGSTLALLDGIRLAPTPSPEPQPAVAESQHEEQPDLPQDLELARRLLAATVREMDLSPKEADEVWRRVRLEIELTHQSPEGDTAGNVRKDHIG
ncbi:hypothetical protein ACFYQA_17470 [Streptomyces sp. NPDC005774]|uniref:hypothetical protein n=1 Tax=Streptomyces sp. NPDC005774 TaxID=3364728 RepID=UPI00368E81F3